MPQNAGTLSDGGAFSKGAGANCGAEENFEVRKRILGSMVVSAEGSNISSEQPNSPRNTNGASTGEVQKQYKKRYQRKGVGVAGTSNL